MQIIRKYDKVVNLQTGEVGSVVKIDNTDAGYRSHLIKNLYEPWGVYWEAPWNIDHYSWWKVVKIKCGIYFRLMKSVIGI